MDLTVDTAGTAARALIRVAGDVDIDTAAGLSHAVKDLLSQGHRDLVVDISDVAFIDSTGLGVLVGALKLTRASEGKLELVCTQRKMLSLLRLTGLDEAFTVHEADIA